MTPANETAFATRLATGSERRVTSCCSGASRHGLYITAARVPCFASRPLAILKYSGILARRV